MLLSQRSGRVVIARSIQVWRAECRSETRLLVQRLREPRPWLDDFWASQNVRHQAAMSGSGRAERKRTRVPLPFDTTGGSGGGSSASDAKPFWEELREAERRKRDANKFLRQKQLSEEKRFSRGGKTDDEDDVELFPRRSAKGEKLRVATEEEVDAFLGPAEALGPPLRGSETSERKTASARSDRRQHDSPEDEPGIREVQPQPSVAADVDPDAMPSNLSPACERLLACRSAGAALAQCASAIANLQAAGGANMKPWLEELALAAQVLARWSNGWQKGQIRRDSRFVDLFVALADNAHDLEPWALVSALRGLARFGASHASTPSLMEAAVSNLGNFNIQQVSLLLRGLSQAPALSGFKAGSSLQSALVDAIKHRHEELDGAGAALLAPALVKLRVAEHSLSFALAAKVKRGARELHIQDLAQASSSLVSLRASHAPLLHSTEKAVQESVHLCTPRGVVQLCMALSQGTCEPETYRDFLMPAARSFILDFGARDICTVAESFCKVGAADPDFLADLASGLRPKVKDMEAHEVSVALNVFAPVAYAVPQLLPSVASRTSDLVDELSPRQVSRALRGLSASGCGGPPLFAALRGRAVELANVFYGTHAVDALMALIESDSLTGAALSALLGAVSRSLARMPPEDYVAVLHMLSRVPVELREHIPDGMTDEVLQALRYRGRGPWRCDLDGVSHLLEALRGLQLQDETLLELVCRRLHITLKKSDCTLIQLLKVLDELGQLPNPSRANVLTHLHRRPRLQAAVAHCIKRQFPNNLDLESQVAFARAVARLGYEDEMTQDWLGRLVVTAEEYLDGFPIEVSIDLCWALATLGWQVDWNRQRSRRLIGQRYGGGVDTSGDSNGDPDVPGSFHTPKAAACDPVAPVEADPLLRFAWSLAVLNEGVPAGLLEELYSAYDGLLPNDWCGTSLRLLQEVALHVQLPGGLRPHEERGVATTQTLHPDVAEWMQLVREAPRLELHERHSPPRSERSARAGKIVVKRYPHEHWLSSALEQLRLPHEAGATVAGGTHRVAVAFRKQRHAIDVLGHQDISVPAGRVLGGAELRRRQLLQAGWAVHPVKLYDLYSAARSGSMRLLVSKMLSSFDPKAARSSSFRKPAKMLQAQPNNGFASGGAGSGFRHSQTVHILRKRRDLPAAFADADVDDEADDPQEASKDPRARLRERAMQAAKAVRDDSTA